MYPRDELIIKIVVANNNIVLWILSIIIEDFVRPRGIMRDMGFYWIGKNTSTVMEHMRLWKPSWILSYGLAGDGADVSKLWI